MVGQVWKYTQQLVPGFKFLSGGLADSGTQGQGTSGWLVTALNAADDEITPQSSPFFALQGLAYHAYGAPYWTSGMARIRTLLLEEAMDTFARDNGVAAAPPVWITEFGWRYSANPDGVNTRSEADIAFQYENFLNWYARHMQERWGPGVGGAFAYSLRNTNAGGAHDGMGLLPLTGTTQLNDTTQAPAGPPMQAWYVLLNYIP